jgi:cell wall-associated NlpC family hydrolase
MNIPFGSSLPGFVDGKGKLNDLEYSFNGNFINRKNVKPDPNILQQLTAQWLNAPYMWGGRTILGVDCSGFVQVNYKMMGIDLLRDAWQQTQQGTTVKKLKEVICGDLAFFDDKDEIVHVGILLSPDQIIHASGKVRIDTIDKKGIINTDTGKRTHLLRSIKRYW